MEYLRYCNLGLVFGMAVPNYHSFNHLSQVLRDPFFSAIEIRDFWSYSQKEQIELQRMLGISLMEITYETQPLLLYNPEYNLNSPDTEVRNKTINRLKKEINAAALLRAKNVVMTSGKYIDGISEETQLSYLVNSLIQLTSYAKEKGVRLLIEPFDRDLDKKMLVGSLPITLQLIKQVYTHDSSFGILLDCGRFPFFNESRQEIVRTLGKYIMQVHIGNCVLEDSENPAYGDKHPRFGIINGMVNETDIALFLKDLYDVGFLKKGGDKVISLEARPVEGEEPELIIANLKRAFIKAWNIFSLSNIEGR